MKRKIISIAIISMFLLSALALSSTAKQTTYITKVFFMATNNYPGDLELDKEHIELKVKKGEKVELSFEVSNAGSGDLEWKFTALPDLDFNGENDDDWDIYVDGDLISNPKDEEQLPDLSSGESAPILMKSKKGIQFFSDLWRWIRLLNTNSMSEDVEEISLDIIEENRKEYTRICPNPMFENLIKKIISQLPALQLLLKI